MVVCMRSNHRLPFVSMHVASLHFASPRSPHQGPIRNARQVSPMDGTGAELRVNCQSKREEGEGEDANQ